MIKVEKFFSVPLCSGLLGIFVAHWKKLNPVEFQFYFKDIFLQDYSTVKALILLTSTKGKR